MQEIIFLYILKLYIKLKIWINLSTWTGLICVLNFLAKYFFTKQLKLIYLSIVFSSSKSILKRKGSQDLPASDYYAIYRQTKKTSLQQTNAPCKF